MKMIKISMLALALGLMSFSAIAPVQSLVSETEIGETASTIVWKAETIDVGQIPQGTPKAIVYEFKNTGNAPLIISNAKGSCGCTVPEWPKEPIAPGAKGVITVKYDTKRSGAINKNVTITSNAVNEPTKVIRIKGNVAPQPEGTSPVNDGGAPSAH